MNRFLWIIALVSTAFAGSAGAATYNPLLASDGIAKDYYEETNFSEVNLLSTTSDNRQVGNVPSGGGIPRSISRSAFEFDLATLPTLDPLQDYNIEASISLNGLTFGGSVKEFEIYSYYGNGIMDPADFFVGSSPVSNFFVGPGSIYDPICGFYDPICGLTTQPYTSFSVTADISLAIRKAIEGDFSFAGFLVVSAFEGDEYQWIDIFGSQYSPSPNPDLLPKITVSIAPVPLPAGIVLLLTSLAALFGLGSRKRRLGTTAKAAC